MATKNINTFRRGGLLPSVEVTEALFNKIGRAAVDANGVAIDWAASEYAGVPLVVVAGSPPTVRPGTDAPLTVDVVAAIISEHLDRPDLVLELGERTGTILIDAAAGANQTLIAVGDITIAGVVNAVKGRTVIVRVRAAGGTRSVTFGGECQFTAASLPGGANPVDVATTEILVFDILPHIELDGTHTTLIRNVDRPSLANPSAPVMQSVTISPEVGVIGGTFHVTPVATGNPDPEFSFAWFRNDAPYGSDEPTITLGAGQQGAIHCVVTPTNSEGSGDPMTGYARAGRLISSYVGETIQNNGAAGSSTIEILLAEGSVAGQECIITAAMQTNANFAFPAGFGGAGYVPRISSDSANLYWLGFAHKTIRQVDAEAGKMLADDDTTPLTMTIFQNSIVKVHTIKDFEGLDWDGTFNRLTNANTVGIKTRGMPASNLLLIILGSADYTSHAMTATLPGYTPGLTVEGHVDPRKGLQTFTRKVGSGTLAAANITTTGPATGTLTTLTLCLTAPAAVGVSKKAGNPEPGDVSQPIGAASTYSMAQHADIAGAAVWTKVSGPAWATIDGASGVVSFTPAAGTAAFVFRCTVTTSDGPTSVDWSMSITGVAASGDGDLPGTPANITVATTAQFASAIAGVPAGAGAPYIIEVTANIGVLTFPTNYNRTKKVIVRSPALSARRTVTGISAPGLRNVEFQALDIHNDAQNAFGFPSGTLVTLSGTGTGVAFRGCWFRGGRFQILGHGSEGFVIHDCTFEGWGCDCIRFFNTPLVTGPNLQRLWFHSPNMDPRQTDQDGNATTKSRRLDGTLVDITGAEKDQGHPDGIQQNRKIDGMIMRDILMDLHFAGRFAYHIGGYHQGIFLAHVGITALGQASQNLEMTRVEIIGSHVNGLVLNGQNNAVLTDIVLRSTGAEWSNSFLTTPAANLGNGVPNPNNLASESLRTPGLGATESGITSVHLNGIVVPPAPGRNGDGLLDKSGGTFAYTIGEKGITVSNSATPAGWAGTLVAQRQLGHAFFTWP